MAQKAIDLATVAALADDLGVSADDTVQRVLSAASRAIATYCGRTFERDTAITEYPPGYGRPVLILSRAPILSITSITEGGALVDSALYESVGDLAAAGMVLRKGGAWMRTARDVGRVTPGDGHHHGETGVDGITVVYSGGWVTPGQAALQPELTVTLPEEIQEAALLTAVAMYRRRGVDPNITSESIGDWSVSYAGTNTAIGRGGAIPETAAALLAPYRVY